MQGVQLRGSCDTCTASKVKCSGGAQCSRCQAKGIACFYSPRKKRGPPKKRAGGLDKTLPPNVLAMNKPSLALGKSSSASAALNALGLHEKRSWSVFFSLYKHYNTSCSRFWFNRQLNKMRAYLKRQDNTAALKRLSSWMEALNIDVEDMERQMERCMLSHKKEAVENARRIASMRATNQGGHSVGGAADSNIAANNGPQAQPGLYGTMRPGQTMTGPVLHIKGELKELQVSAYTAEQSEVAALMSESRLRDDVPFLRVVSDLDVNLELDAEVEVNAAFTELFGYTQSNIEAQLRWTGGGFLPWGGDVLSRLLTCEKDLLAYVQIMAIKFNTEGPPKVLPCVREMPSTHRYLVTIGEDADEPPVEDDSAGSGAQPANQAKTPVNAGEKDVHEDVEEMRELENREELWRLAERRSRRSKETVQCVIKCVHREVLAVDRSYMEMYFTFHPLYNDPSNSFNQPTPGAQTKMPTNSGVVSLEEDDGADTDMSARGELKRKLATMLPNFGPTMSTPAADAARYNQPKHQRRRSSQEEHPQHQQQHQQQQQRQPPQDDLFAKAMDADGLFTFVSDNFHDTAMGTPMMPPTPSLTSGDLNLNNNSNAINSAKTTGTTVWDLDDPAADGGTRATGTGAPLFGSLPLKDTDSSSSDADATDDQNADFLPDEIDGQWLDSLLDWVKADV